MLYLHENPHLSTSRLAFTVPLSPSKSLILTVCHANTGSHTVKHGVNFRKSHLTPNHPHFFVSISFFISHSSVLACAVRPQILFYPSRGKFCVFDTYSGCPSCSSVTQPIVACSLFTSLFLSHTLSFYPKNMKGYNREKNRQLKVHSGGGHEGGVFMNMCV